jgi:hypothetical protein
VEFEWFGPFYAANPEHLGQQSPADVLTMLRRTPDEVAHVLKGRADVAVRLWRSTSGGVVPDPVGLDQKRWHD